LPHVEFIDGYITYVFDKNQAKSMISRPKNNLGRQFFTNGAKPMASHEKKKKSFSPLLCEGDAFARKFRNQFFEQKLIKNNQIR
jgi:hypothetical protein